MTDQPRLIAEERAEYTTASPDAERAAYVERLREKLADPEFRRIEGFPIGDDEAILALSDPPYYTQSLPARNPGAVAGGAAPASS